MKFFNSKSLNMIINRGLTSRFSCIKKIFVILTILLCTAVLGIEWILGSKQASFSSIN